MQEIDTKKDMAEQFLNDSRDYLKRFLILREGSLNGSLGMRSKLFIDLLFSAECSIKSLIFFESMKDANTKYDIIYNKIRTHTISKLLDKLSSTEKQVCSGFIDKMLMDYDVGNRYMVEADKTYRRHKVLDNDYYDTIANYQWIDFVYKKLRELHEHVCSMVVGGCEKKFISLADPGVIKNIVDNIGQTVEKKK
jgi:hypothetical protein